MKVATHFLVATLVLCFAGCAVRQQTVVAKPIVSTQASFDDNVQNSGIVRLDEHGWIVTANWIARYDALLDKYGTRLVPQRKAGNRDGITQLTEHEVGKPGVIQYCVTAQVLARHVKLNTWLKADRGP